MKNIKFVFVLGVLVGLTFFFMGAFTRDWTESTPTDSTVANQIDDFNRYVRVDVSDRLENMFYGFIAGENTLSQHCQYLQFYEQASVSQPSAAYGRLYTKAVGGKCELHWQDEDGDEIQLTTGGDWGGSHIRLLAGMDLLGSSTSDITINTDKFTVAGATGNTVIAGTCDITGATEVIGVATVGDGSLTKTSAAPTTDAMIANKKYVDDSVVKGWAMFRTRTSNGACTVDASSNVTSVNRSAAGKYNVVWATDFSSANYAVVAMLHDAASGPRYVSGDRGNFNTAGITYLETILPTSGDVSEAVANSKIYVIAIGAQ